MTHEAGIITGWYPVYRGQKEAVEQADDLSNVSLLVNRTNLHPGLSSSPPIFSVTNKGPKPEQVAVDGAEREGHSKPQSTQEWRLIACCLLSPKGNGQYEKARIDFLPGLQAF